MSFEKIFYCSRCGALLQKRLKICTRCGFDPNRIHLYGDVPAIGAGGVGWSDRVGDPLFSRYQKRKRLYIFIFGLILILSVSSILFAVGDLSFDREGLLVTIIISSMFAIIAFFSISGTLRKGKDWEGVVEDKHDNTLFIRLSNNRTIEISFGECATLFTYYKIGDRVKKHQKANLRALEKYDKRLDGILFCPSCASIADTRADYCAACGSPLLKGRMNE